MKKIWLLITIMALLSLAAHAERFPMVPLNGQPMVALSTFADAFGAATTFDNATNVITISLGPHTLQMIPYWGWGWVDGQSVQIETPPVIVDSTVYVPIRIVAAAFDLPVTWVQGNWKVTISYPVTQMTEEFVLDDNFARMQHQWQLVYARSPFFDTNIDAMQLVQNRVNGTTIAQPVNILATDPNFTGVTLSNVSIPLGSGFRLNPFSVQLAPLPPMNPQLTPFAQWSQAMASGRGFFRLQPLNSGQLIGTPISPVIPTPPSMSPVHVPITPSR